MIVGWYCIDYTVPSGIRTKWPSRRRNPLYLWSSLFTLIFRKGEPITSEQKRKLEESDFATYDGKVVLTECSSKFQEENKRRVLESIDDLLDMTETKSSYFDHPDGYKRRSDIRKQSKNTFQAKYNSIWMK